MAAQIPDGVSIFMNIGTTTEAVARALLKHRNLMVITNNLNVANILATSPNSEVIVAGGILRRSDGALVGDVTAEFIGQFKVDYAIIGSAAVDPDGSLLDYDFREVRVAQAIIKNARKSYLVADHTKFKMVAPVRIASLAELDGFFTDVAAAEVGHPALRRQRRLHPHRRVRPRALSRQAFISRPLVPRQVQRATRRPGWVSLQVAICGWPCITQAVAVMSGYSPMLRSSHRSGAACRQTIRMSSIMTINVLDC